MTDDHGQCKNCGYDLNGAWIYDYYLKEYNGNEEEAAKTASMFGASKGHGRFGKEIYMKPCNEKLPSYYICPECQQECY